MANLEQKGKTTKIMLNFPSISILASEYVLSKKNFLPAQANNFLLIVMTPCF